jgi:hypothetical protein
MCFQQDLPAVFRVGHKFILAHKGCTASDVGLILEPPISGLTPSFGFLLLKNSATRRLAKKFLSYFSINLGSLLRYANTKPTKSALRLPSPTTGINSIQRRSLTRVDSIKLVLVTNHLLMHSTAYPTNIVHGGRKSIPPLLRIHRKMTHDSLNLQFR